MRQSLVLIFDVGVVKELMSVLNTKRDAHSHSWSCLHFLSQLNSLVAFIFILSSFLGSSLFFKSFSFFKSYPCLRSSSFLGVSLLLKLSSCFGSSQFLGWSSFSRSPSFFLVIQRATPKNCVKFHQSPLVSSYVVHLHCAMTGVDTNFF